MLALLPTMWPLASFLTSQNFVFLICKLKDNAIPMRYVSVGIWQIINGS